MESWHPWPSRQKPAAPRRRVRAPRATGSRPGSPPSSPSATLAVDAKAKALQAQGESVIGFGAGEPDFPTPDTIVAAAEAACRDPRNHRYTPTAGLPELREAIAAKTRRDSGLEVAASQVLVTNGGKQAVANTFAVLCDPGDEVLVPAPYWTTYPESITLAGGVPVVVATDAGRRLPGDRRPARGRPHAQDQGAAVRVPVQPDRGGLPPWGDGGDRSVGRVHGHLGGHRRDLRAPGLRGGGAPLDAGAGARAGRHLRGGQRGGQDLRHDRLAGGVDAGTGRRDRRGHQPAVPRDVQRGQRVPAGCARRRVRRPGRRGHDARGLRPPPA